MPTVDQYQGALAQATEAGDTEAVRYFQTQIAKGVRQPAAQTDAYGREVPQGGSILSPIGQGLTLGFADEIAGAAAGVGSKLSGGDFTPAYEATRDDFRQASKDYAGRNPMTSAAVEIGSGLALPGGLLARAGMGAGSGLRGAMLAGGLAGTGTAEGGVSERIEGAAAGAAGGAALHTALRPLSALGRTFFRRASPKAEGPAFQDQVALLEQNGIRVTPAERLATPAGRMDERMVGGYMGVGDDIARRPQQLHGRLMEMSNFAPEDAAIGELSAEAVQRARGRFNADYGNHFQGVTVDTANLQPALTGVEARHAAFLPHEQRANVRAIVQEFNDAIAQGRQFTGEEYQRLRSQMGKRAEAASRSEQNNYLAPVYRELRGALDDAFNAAVPQGAQDALRATNRQYSGFKILEHNAKNPDGLGTMANRAWENRSRLNPEFHDLARAYQNVLQRGYPQSSGTAENIASSSMLPPVLPMIRSAGTTASAATQGLRLPGPLRGKRSLAIGTAGSMAAQDAVSTNQTKRKRRDRGR
jgi:hypothetical protein